MSKRVKTLVMSEITKRFGDNKDFLVLDASKVTAVKVNKLRLRAEKLGIKMLAVKNTLALKALTEVGVTTLNPVMTGPSALVWGGADMVALAKEIAKWAKEKDLKDLKIKGGTIDGTALDEKGVDLLSKSAGKPELLGQILSLIKSPGGQLAAALIGPGGYLSGQVKALAEKTEEAEAAEEGSETPVDAPAAS
jgi:large subunit ribosomal protein L10